MAELSLFFCGSAGGCVGCGTVVGSGVTYIYNETLVVQNDITIEEWMLTLKNKQDRFFNIPPSVVHALKKVKSQQAEWKLQYGLLYNNKENLIFTNQLGKHLCCPTIYAHFKKIAKKIDIPELRFHDVSARIGRPKTAQLD